MSSAETKDAPAVPAVPEPAHILRVATAQFRPQQGGIEANVARMVLFLREAGVSESDANTIDTVLETHSNYAVPRLLRNGGV